MNPGGIGIGLSGGLVSGGRGVNPDGGMSYGPGGGGTDLRDNTEQPRGYGGLDRFRLIAAFLIVAIHTSPLASVNGELDFLAVRVAARVAVPFFLMVTGYFWLQGSGLSADSDNKKDAWPPAGFVSKNRTAPLFSSIRKTALLYAVATAIYLPFSIYAGYYSEGNAAASFARNLIFDGTFYHLWYLPASIIGVLLLFMLTRRFSLRAILLVSGALYLTGLFGDSYYGVSQGIPALNAFYDAAFHIFSYTRNGLFYAPVFLAMGAVVARAEKRLSAKASLTGFSVSMALMLAEGGALHSAGLQRHDSMYFMLVPCMYFLFQFLLARRGKPRPSLRGVSMWVYILHPLFIIVIRAAAKAAGLTGLLVENSLNHYFAVCLLSLVFSMLITSVWSKRKTPPTRFWSHKSIGARSMTANTAVSTPLPVRRCGKESDGAKGIERCRARTGRAWIELDMENLRKNVNMLRGILPDTCRLMPAVKANAYGHGAVAVCRELNRLGVQAFCVASAAEGAELRKHNIKGDILVLGYTHPEQFHMLRRFRLMQTVIDYEYAKTLNAYGKKITVHIKVDTGMRRLGETTESAGNIIKIFECENLAIAGVYSHFSAQDSSDPRDASVTQAQVDGFNRVLSEIRAQGIALPKTHMQNSYGVFSRPDLSFDYARPGIALYGGCRNGNSAAASAPPPAAASIPPPAAASVPPPAAAANTLPDAPTNPTPLPVLSLKARVSIVKTVRAGEPVGYGDAFTAGRDMKIAVLSAGYADGIPRTLSCGAGHVLLGGQPAPIVGAICMDQITVDVTKIGNVRQGDAAVFIGRDGEYEITAMDLADRVGSIPNEILSRLGSRLERCILPA